MLAKMEAGIQEAETAIIRYYDDKQGRIDTEAAMADDSDEDSKESGCYTSDSTFQGQPVKPRGTYYFGEYLHREDAIKFAKALPHLLLTFTCSFHAENELDQQCVCPCAFKCVKPWMSKLSKHPKDNPDGLDDISTATPPWGSKTKKDNSEITSKVIKFRFVVSMSSKRQVVAPSVVHTHWMQAVQEALDTEVVIYNNRNRKVDKII